jgi:PiT family inorganic phosphate transporter
MVLVILFGLIFALSNGLHDASSVVATAINCGAASPRQAIGIASLFGLLGAVFAGSQVSDTVTKVIDLPDTAPLLPILLAAVLGATAWNVITWRLGLPSSSTHALIGGIAGAVTVAAGPSHIVWGVQELIGPGHEITGMVKIVASLILSPVLGFAIAFLFEKAAKLLLRNAKATINKPIKRVQLLFAAGLSFSHGANDSQKIIGIIVLALAAGNGTTLASAPLWLKACAGSVMFLGTMFGGWTIMKTIGRGIFSLEPIHSLNSQLASVASLVTANLTGAPVSTTHVVVGSVMGVGSADQYKMVRWSIVKDIIVAWFITIPLSGAVSARLYSAIHLILSI